METVVFVFPAQLLDGKTGSNGWVDITTKHLRQNKHDVKPLIQLVCTLRVCHS